MTKAAMSSQQTCTGQDWQANRAARHIKESAEMTCPTISKNSSVESALNWNSDGNQTKTMFGTFFFFFFFFCFCFFFSFCLLFCCMMDNLKVARQAERKSQTDGREWKLQATPNYMIKDGDLNNLEIDSNETSCCESKRKSRETNGRRDLQVH